MFVNCLQIGASKPIFDLNIAPLDPPQIAHAQSKSLKAGTRLRVAFDDAKHTPTRRVRSGCCADNDSGHAAAEPATTLMKSRRRTQSSREAKDDAGCGSKDSRLSSNRKGRG